MKKSDLKLLQARLQKASQPPPPSKKRDDLSDELSKMFDDGTVLESDKTSLPPNEVTRLDPSGGQTPSEGQGDRGRQSKQAISGPVPSPGPSVAPERDFNRRANSLERDALPAGKFPGASKKIYDALYLRTRGAMKPVRTLTATKRQIGEWSGIRNRKTIDGHLRYLETCGLIVRQWDLGSNEGYVFEVRLPEEAPLVDRGTEGVRPTEGSDQKMDRGSDQKMDTGGQSQIIEKAATSESPKTFKTNTEQSDDDEAFAFLRAAFKEHAKREVTPVELSELDELLTTEYRIAAARTTVSSPAAFLAEHLRRRLWKKEKRQIEREGDSSAPQTKVNASQCPNCFGTGMWYPEGYEKGVAKCKHEKLADVSRTQ
jgi:hypothetical protein